MIDTPAAAQAVQVPPCPPWAREETHRRFWSVVARADEQERLPDSVFDDAPSDATEAEDDAEQTAGAAEADRGAGGEVR